MTIKFSTALLIFIFVCQGCSVLKKNVAPYERGILSQSQMAFIPNDALEIGAQHMLNAREGSVGGSGGAGGGCGCN